MFDQDMPTLFKKRLPFHQLTKGGKHIIGKSLLEEWRKGFSSTKIINLCFSNLTQKNAQQYSNCNLRTC